MIEIPLRICSDCGDVPGEIETGIGLTIRTCRYAPRDGGLMIVPPPSDPSACPYAAWARLARVLEHAEPPAVPWPPDSKE